MISKINRLVYASLFLALALVLPFLTGQIPQIGAMLTPMHFPVLLCGFFVRLAVGHCRRLCRASAPLRPVWYAGYVPHGGLYGSGACNLCSCCRYAVWGVP